MSDRRENPMPQPLISGLEEQVSSRSETRATTSSPQSDSLEIDDTNIPRPRFMQHEDDSKQWNWIPFRIRKFGVDVANWAKGPSSPRPYKIKPLLPDVQQAPIHLLHKILPDRIHRVALFIGYAIAWLLAFVLVYRQGSLASEIAKLGQPQDVGCGTTFWSAGNSCGIDGSNCRPFSNASFAFKCPANCASYRLLNPRAVGDQEVIYQPLIVGGPRDATSDSDAVYRGDSFLCGAAIHDGIVTNAGGGCGVVDLIGTQSNFVASSRHGIDSVGFDSYFPLSYTFRRDIECTSQDVRWSLFAVSVTFTVVLSLMTNSAGLLFFPTFISAFWQVGMASDAPNIQDTASLFSDILGKFLPAMFIAWIFFDKMGVRRALDGLEAPVEKTVLWLGALWVGALTNYTFDFIPIQRLNSHDLQQQPGAKAALAVIIIVLVVIVATQVWFFRQEARLIKYLKLYALLVVSILICLALPGLSLRIHHYILALLLLPGTSIQTRPSLVYQGILLGLFINGIARWGFDPFLQTADALRNDAQYGSLLPNILTPVIGLGAVASNITFQWDPPPRNETPRYNGISVLVNDVERFRTFFDETGKDSFVWDRNATLDMNEYFRFAWIEGTDPADYTRAGIWDARGNWTAMEPGPSKLKTRRITDVPVPFQTR